MAIAKLNVVMYRPTFGNFEHWALHLEINGEHEIFEVVSEHPNFQKNEVKGQPQRSNRFLRSYRVGTFNVADLPAFRNEIEKAKVDNKTVHWNCQDYVLEIVDALVEECVIDEEDYGKVEDKIRGHFGAR